MLFITTLKLEKLNEQNIKVLNYYLLTQTGINDPLHIQKLENIYEQIINEEEISIPKKQTTFNRILRRGI